jgi:putative ABC transport system permease protein
MLRAAWKTALAHKTRLALTSLAVVMGVALVAGTLVLTDSLEQEFQGILAQTAGGSDLSVRPAVDETSAATADGLPADLVERTEAVEGVALADPVVRGTAQLIDRAGEPIGEPIGGGGMPALGENAPAQEGMRGLELREGRFPEAAGEVAVDAKIAGSEELALGDTVRYVTTGRGQEAELVGIFGYRSADSLPTTTLTLFDPSTAAEEFSPDGTVDRIDVLVESGADADEVAGRVTAALGDGYEVVTAQQALDEDFAGLGEGLAFISPALLAFGAIALFVGSFIIFNAFSMIVAQRTREIALLRAVGASRVQTFGSIIVEAGVTGLIGGFVGVGAGFGVAVGLRRLLGLFGVDLPDGALALAPRTVVVGVAVGFFVTLLAALLPAVRATRVAPIVALTQVASSRGVTSRTRLIGGGLLALAGLGALANGLLAGGGPVAVVAGAVGTFLGMALLAPVVARPLVWVIGAPIAKAFGLIGHLARENAQRSPARTASMASALMIGLGLVAAVSVVASSLHASFQATLDEVFLMDYRVEPATFAGDPAEVGISRDLQSEIEALPEVGAAGPEQVGFFTFGGTQDAVLAVDAGTVGSFYAFEMVEGSFDTLAGGGIAVSELTAERQGWEIGDAIAADVPSGTVDWEIVGLFDGEAFDANFITDNATFDGLYGRDHVNRLAVTLAAGVTPTDAEPALAAVVEGYPTARLLDNAALGEELSAAVDQLFALVTVLLLLSVLVALFGIVNTLALAVLERTRELGLLRAVGMTRAQVRAMVRWESVMVSVLGGVFGIVVGLAFGWIVGTALAEFGVTQIVVPFAWLAAGLLVAGLAGVLAGVVPARRASRVDVLTAISGE